MRTIGMITNTRNDRMQMMADQISEWLGRHRYTVLSIVGDDGASGYSALGDIGQAEDLPDMIVAVGGDGTLLSAARTAAPFNVPVLGINMGNLGFLTEVESDQVYPNLERVLRGEYVVDYRMMLQVETRRDGETIHALRGLNDAVIHKGSLSRLLEINFWVEEDFAGSCKGDGIIIASPTGSTGYSLSAGGPVVHPSLEVMVQTWICPHTITARPAIIPADRCCIVELVDVPNEVLLTVDGQTTQPLRIRDQVVITKAPYKAALIRLAPLKFYSLLKTKLGSETLTHFD